jgi:hypothetical protein
VGALTMKITHSRQGRRQRRQRPVPTGKRHLLNHVQTFRRQWADPKEPETMKRSQNKKKVLEVRRGQVGMMMSETTTWWYGIFQL